MYRRSIQYVTFMGVISILAGCAATTSRASHANGPERLSPMAQYIEASRIQQSGAATAWDAVRLLTPSLALGEVGPLGARRAPTTSGSGELGMPRPRVIVDGFVLPDFSALRAIPATSVIDIQLIGSLDAMLRFGSGYGGGAIVVRTLTGSQRD